MEEILAPVNTLPTGFAFDFEQFLEQELGLFLNPRSNKNNNQLCKYFMKGQCRHGGRCQFKHSRQDKTVMCKHWLRGLCKKGDNCEFLHEFDMSKMPECWFYSNYGECSNQECVYLHIDPESKVKQCPWYNRGFCKHGTQCRNKHVRKVVCQRFLTGFCPLGDKCELGHPKFELPRSMYDNHHSSNVDDHHHITIVKPQGVLAGGGGGQQ